MFMSLKDCSTRKHFYTLRINDLNPAHRQHRPRRACQLAREPPDARAELHNALPLHGAQHAQHLRGTCKPDSPRL